MVRRFIDQNGTSVVLGQELGSGGEGAVYEISGIPGLVAKIYHAPVTLEKAEKLRLMTGMGDAGLFKFASWPKATLHDRSGGPVTGLVLPRVSKGREIHELYSPAHRKLHFPQADWRFLIRVARNCAAAFHSLHERGIVIGDVNQGNVFVSNDALVSLIDCDSFQVRANSKSFRCQVGVAHFVPPELQTAKLDQVDRSPNHDNFGLAVLIFHLLFVGRHPFAGKYSGPGEMPIEKAIQEYRFAYSSKALQYHMSPPPHSLPMAALSADIVALFERAFLRSQAMRPTSKDWADSLAHFEKTQRACDRDIGHIFHSGKPSCPWCDIERGGGPDFFVTVTVGAALTGNPSFNLSKILAEIKSAQQPGDGLLVPAQTSLKGYTPRRFDVREDEYYVLRHGTFFVAVLSWLLTLVFMNVSILNICLFTIATTFSIWRFAMHLQRPERIAKIERTQTLQQKRELQQQCWAKREELLRNEKARFKRTTEDLLSVARKYESLDSDRQEAVNSLQRTATERQMEEYLKRCFIADDRIPNIGIARIATLASYGIETAFDIDYTSIILIDGFKDSLATALLTWRRSKELQFKPNAAQGVPKSDLQMIELKFMKARIKYERMLDAGPSDLRQITKDANKELDKLAIRWRLLSEDVLKAEADLRALG